MSDDGYSSQWSAAIPSYAVWAITATAELLVFIWRLIMDFIKN